MNTTPTSATPSATELSPPQAFELEPPAPVAAVPVESASGRVRLKPEELKALDEQVRAFVGDIASLDGNDPKFRETAERIHAMGNKDIEASASVSNRMLERPVKTMKSG